MAESVREATLGNTEEQLAEHQLMHTHQGLVKSIAISIHQSLGGTFELEDLIAYGQIGLAQCAAKYDSTTATKFSSFAYHRIRGAIYDGISQMNWLKSEDYKNHKREILSTHMLSVQNHDEASTEWLEGNVTRMFLIGFAIDLDAEQSRNSVSDVETQEALILLRDAVSRLNERERFLIENVYFQRQTLVHVAKELSITRSGASRMHSRALDHLEKILHEQGMDADSLHLDT